MRKVFFSLFFLSFVSIEPVVAEQLSIEEIKVVTDKMKDECARKVFPEDENDEMYNVYDDSLKRVQQQYAQCIKQTIFKIIDDNFENDDAQAMRESVEGIEKNVLEFYFVLNGKSEGGTLGRLQNDVENSHRLDDILYDIILKLHTY